MFKFYTLFCLFLPLTILAQDLCIRNVNLIPLTSDTLIRSQDVWVSNGYITKIAATGSEPLPEGIPHLNATGLYLMPGLMDMHVHFFYEQGVDSTLLSDEAFVMLANGVTTARVMCGDSLYLDVRDKVAAGIWDGPRFFVTSPQFVGEWKWDGLFLGTIVTNPEEGRAAVRKAKRQGYDEIKITLFVQADTYQGIVSEAKKMDMKVTGHIGPDIKLPAALRAGQQIEHYDEFMEMLLPDTSYNHGVSVSGSGVWDREKAWPTMEYVDSSRIDELVKQVKASGIYVTPTNFFLHSSFGYELSPEQIANRPDYDFFPASLKKYWADVAAYYWNNPPKEEWREKYISIRRLLTYRLWRAGVPLMTGSDAPDWHLVPGFSTHDELNEFALCGLPNYEILKTATVIPAKYLGLEKTNGTIEVGKEADFLLLSGNPLEQISHTRNRIGVVNNGKWFSEETISQRMEKIREKMLTY